MILMNVPAARSAPSLAVLGGILLAGCLTGCSALGGEGSASGRQITAAFYPLAFAAERVAGDHLDVVTLTEPGQEPHDLELDIRRTAEIEKARLVIYESGFQPAVDASVEQNAEGAVLDAAEAVELRPYDDHEAGHDAEEHGHEEDHESEHDGHDHGDLDSHFWQDPLLMADFTDALADELAEVDPDHADAYAANAAEVRADLEELDQEYADGLASCTIDTVVVNHDAFGYLTRYGLHFESITGLSPGATPTVADRARLEDLVSEEGITTVFSEALGSKQAARSLADDAGVTAEVLDPIEGLSENTSDEDYFSLMRSNLAKLRKANGC